MNIHLLLICRMEIDFFFLTQFVILPSAFGNWSIQPWGWAWEKRQHCSWHDYVDVFCISFALLAVDDLLILWFPFINHLHCFNLLFIIMIFVFPVGSAWFMHHFFMLCCSFYISFKIDYLLPQISIFHLHDIMVCWTTSRIVLDIFQFSLTLHILCLCSQSTMPATALNMCKCTHAWTHKHSTTLTTHT